MELSEYKDQMFGETSGIEKVNVREEDSRIGGLTSLRAWLAEQGDLLRSDLSKTSLHPPKGVLLVGVPGCGKSLSAKAIASEWRLPLYRLAMASILGMYVGVSESRLKEALDMADRVAPCVLWVDEIEKALASFKGALAASAWSGADLPIPPKASRNRPTIGSVSQVNRTRTDRHRLTRGRRSVIGHSGDTGVTQEQIEHRC